jgi:hypothetical protein
MRTQTPRHGPREPTGPGSAHGSTEPVACAGHRRPVRRGDAIVLYFPDDADPGEARRLVAEHVAKEATGVDGAEAVEGIGHIDHAG